MKKLIIIMIIGLAGWQVLFNDAVSNMLLALVLDGQVPFSSVVLSPQATIGITAGMIFLLVFGLLMILAPSPATRDMPHPTPALPLPQEVTVTAAEATDPIIKTTSPKAAGSPVLYRRGSQWHIRRRFRLAHKIMLLRERLHAFKVDGKQNVQELSVKSRENLNYSVQSTAVKSVKSSRFIARGSKNMWRAVSPYLWRFDAWLEHRTQTMRKSLSDSFRSYDSLATLIDITSETLAIIGLRRPGPR